MSSNDVIEHFATRAATFSKNGWADNEAILQTIVNGIMNFCPSTEVLLDFGAGTGVVSKHLLDKLPNIMKITALDISSDMLSQIQDERIECVVSSVDSTPFYNSEFDLIVSRQCLHYVHDLTKALAEAKRILKKHGIFILTQFVPSLLSTERFTILNSVAKWSNQYTMIDDKEKQKYISKLLNAPDSYKIKYNIAVAGTDIIGKTHGVTLIFESR